MSTSPVGIVPAGLPLIIEPSSRPSDTSLIYTLPTSKPFSHIAVFLMPGVSLPPETALAIYLASAQEMNAATLAGETPGFKFLGGIGPGKESSVFKIGVSPSSGGGGSDGWVVGVSIEPADSVSARMQEVAAASKTAAANTRAPNTVALAQSIIKNAFNFLASFSGTAGPGQVEVVPIKAFEEWWRKFESRLRADPSFLERQGD